MHSTKSAGWGRKGLSKPTKKRLAASPEEELDRWGLLPTVGAGYMLLNFPPDDATKGSFRPHDSAIRQGRLQHSLAELHSQTAP